MVDELVKARIPKPTATKLIDRIDRGNLESDNPKWINLENDVQDLKNDVGFVKNDVRWLRWVVTSLVALMFGIVGIVTYLHNDMKAEIQSLRTEMQLMQKEISAKIDQILFRRR